MFFCNRFVRYQKLTFAKINNSFGLRGSLKVSYCRMNLVAMRKHKFALDICPFLPSSSYFLMKLSNPTLQSILFSPSIDSPTYSHLNGNISLRTFLLKSATSQFRWNYDSICAWVEINESKCLMNVSFRYLCYFSLLKF